MEVEERLKREVPPLNEEERALTKECSQFFVDILNERPLSTHDSKGEGVKGNDEFHQQEAMRVTLERFDGRLKSSVNLSEEDMSLTLTSKYKEWKHEQMEKMHVGEEGHKKNDRAASGRGKRAGGGRGGRGRGRGGGKRLGKKRGLHFLTFSFVFILISSSHVSISININVNILVSRAWNRWRHCGIASTSSKRSVFLLMLHGQIRWFAYC